jgi:ATP-dependent DNA ligase
MARIVKRPVSVPAKTSAARDRRDATSTLPRWIPPQLCQPVESAPSGPQWLHEIKLDGFRMAARIEHGRVKLLTRTGLDWSDKYPSVIAALEKASAKTAYLDGELCGVGADGLPSFSQTQAASDGERDVRLVYYAFDLLHLDGWDTSSLPLIERKALLEPLVANTPGVQFNGHETGDGELIRKHAGQLGFEGVVSNTIDAPGNRDLWRKTKWLNRQEFVVVGLVRPGRIAAASRSAFARLLHRRRQTDLCRPRWHGDARQGARTSPPRWLVGNSRKGLRTATAAMRKNSGRPRWRDKRSIRRPSGDGSQEIETSRHPVPHRVVPDLRAPSRVWHNGLTASEG